MSSPLPPDPYLALGVAQDASAAMIKTTYRKLALKCHPDKVSDESLKQAAADQFHKIQTAYEIVGDEDRRARYDAQSKLAQLKKEAMERGSRGPVEVRTAAYKMPTGAPRSAAFHARGPERADRVSPVYEERRPDYASDYFDVQAPRASARSDRGYERPSRRTPPAPRDDRDHVQAQARDDKESERARQGEKSRRRERERVRDRDRKTASVVNESTSEDEYERQARRVREEDAELRRARPQYHDQARRHREEATHGYYDGEDRAHKLYSLDAAAREHMESRRRTDSEKRPSPERVPTSKDKVEYIKRTEGRPPVMVRRGSGRPKTLSREESRRGSVREGERRSSLVVVEESRRPPPLVQSMSSPPEIRPPIDRQRSHSVQHDKEDLPPKIKRSETMPHAVSRDSGVSHRKDPVLQKGSGLRQTEIVDGQPTPGPTPGVYSNSQDPRYRYQTEYADDTEFPTTDGYRTEIREPTPASRPRYTRSPSPTQSRDGRDKPRTTSARYGSPQRPQPSRTTSTSYVYTPGQGVESYRAPASRGTSGRADRDRLYYGEIPTTASTTARPSPKPSASYSSKYSPPLESSGSGSARYPKDVRPEDIRAQSGYEYSGGGGGSRRMGPTSRPSYSRSGSSSVYVR